MRTVRAVVAPRSSLLAPGLTSPPFGEPGRDALLARRLVGPLTAYAQVLDRARAVAGDTPSPYAAAVALERWLRTTGGFTYSTQPPATPGVPPLAGFVLDTKTGYCQHFGGAMALMLRLLGVPARVISKEATSAYLKYPIKPIGPGAAKDSKPASLAPASTSGDS